MYKKGCYSGDTVMDFAFLLEWHRILLGFLY